MTSADGHFVDSADVRRVQPAQWPSLDWHSLRGGGGLRHNPHEPVCAPCSPPSDHLPAAEPSIPSGQTPRFSGARRARLRFLTSGTGHLPGTPRPGSATQQLHHPSADEHRATGCAARTACGEADSVTATVFDQHYRSLRSRRSRRSQTVQSGKPATLYVSATGTAPLSYQWYKGASATPRPRSAPTRAASPPRR